MYTCWRGGRNEVDRVSMPTGRYHGMAKSNIAIIVVSVALVVFAHIVRHESIHVSTAGWVTIHPLRHMSYFSDRIHSSRGDWFGLVDTRHMLNFRVCLGRGETEEVLSTSHWLVAMCEGACITTTTVVRPWEGIEGFQGISCSLEKVILKVKKMTVLMKML